MPRSRKVADTPSYRSRLLAFAEMHYGYVTPHDARQLAVPTIELPKLAEHRGFTNLGYGVYHFDTIEITPHGRLYEAVLRCGEGAVLADESVLEFYGLLDTERCTAEGPSTVVVGTTRRVRTSLPSWIELRRGPRYGRVGPECAGIAAISAADALNNIANTLSTAAFTEMTQRLHCL